MAPHDVREAIVRFRLGQYYSSTSREGGNAVGTGDVGGGSEADDSVLQRRQSSSTGGDGCRAWAGGLLEAAAEGVAGMQGWLWETADDSDCTTQQQAC